MRRLICAFVVRICHKTRCVSWLYMFTMQSAGHTGQNDVSVLIFYLILSYLILHVFIYLFQLVIWFKNIYDWKIRNANLLYLFPLTVSHSFIRRSPYLFIYYPPVHETFSTKDNIFNDFDLVRWFNNLSPSSSCEIFAASFTSGSCYTLPYSTTEENYCDNLRCACVHRSDRHDSRAR